jgi:hypothetical protein
MTDSGDDHQALGVVDGVDHSVVADSSPVVLSAGKRCYPDRPRIRSETVDDDPDSIAHDSVEASVLASRRGLESDLVPRLPPAGYSRTSAHGTARSRSSRACSAARLSSRYSSLSRSSA